MNELTIAYEHRTITLKDIEYRLQRSKEDITYGLLEIGRALNDAKDHNLVGEADWESWVNIHSGLELRSAQRYMRVARYVQPGTPLSRLNVTKILEIMKLPEAEWDKLALKVEEENMPLRELQNQVKNLRGQVTTMQNNAKDQSAKNISLINERDQLKRDVKRLETAADNWARQSDSKGGMVDELSSQLSEEKKQNQQLRLQLQEALARPAVKVPDLDMQQELAELKKQLAAMEKERDAAEDKAAEYSQKLKAAQRDQRAGMMEDVRLSGNPTERSTFVDIGAAVKNFLGQVGFLPSMRSKMSVARKNDREYVAQCIETMDNWVKECKAMMDAVEI